MLTADAARVMTCDRCGRTVDSRLFRYGVLVVGWRGRLAGSERGGVTRRGLYCGPCLDDLCNALQEEGFGEVRSLPVTSRADVGAGDSRL